MKDKVEIEIGASRLALLRAEIVYRGIAEPVL